MRISPLAAAGIGLASVAGIGLAYYLFTKEESGWPPPEFIENSNGNTFGNEFSNIQVAIDDLGGLPGWVHLPPLDFFGASEFVVRNNAKVYGYQGQTRLIFSGPGSYITSGTENCGLYDLYLTGMGAVRFTGCMNAEIKNITAENIGEIGGTFDPPTLALWSCENSKISNCITYMVPKYGVLLTSSKNCTVEGCNISYSPGAYSGIQVQSSDYSNILNNHVHHIGMDKDNMQEFWTVDERGGPGIRVAKTICHYNKIYNNYVHHVREHGIKVYPTNTNNEVCYNHIHNVNMGNPGGPHGSQPNPYGQCLDMEGVSLVKGNEIGFNAEAFGGIVVGHIESVGAEIDDNHIYHIDEGRHANCITIQVPATVRRNIMEGNGDMSVFQRAINLNAINCIIDNNEMRGFKRGMYMTSANNTSARYNTIKDCERGIRFAGGEGITVTNNIFDCVPTQYEFPEQCIRCTLEPNTIIPC